jgi:choline dehydrogenase-like flavoprotein
MPEEYAADFVIVGAGFGGWVLTNRLSADGRTRVLLLEAGGDDQPLRNPSQFLLNVMIYIPVSCAQTLKHSKLNCIYETEPDPETGERRHVGPRGKVLGGSSSINGLHYIRGRPLDYLSSGRNLRDGCGERRGRRQPASGSRHQQASCRRRQRDAAFGFAQHQCPDNHDCGKGLIPVTRGSRCRGREAGRRTGWLANSTVIHMLGPRPHLDKAD